MGVEMVGSAAIRSAVRLPLGYDDGETGQPRSPNARPGTVRCRSGSGVRTGAARAGHGSPAIPGPARLGGGAAAPERANGGVSPRAHGFHGLAQDERARGPRV